MAGTLSERLEDYLDGFGSGEVRLHDDDVIELVGLLREASELARRVEGAPVCDVEECRYEFAPEEFDIRGSIHCDARLAGKRVALVEVGDGL